MRSYQRQEAHHGQLETDPLLDVTTDNNNDNNQATATDPTRRHHRHLAVAMVLGLVALGGVVHRVHSWPSSSKTMASMEGPSAGGLWGFLHRHHGDDHHSDENHTNHDHSDKEDHQHHGKEQDKHENETEHHHPDQEQVGGLWGSHQRHDGDDDEKHKKHDLSDEEEPVHHHDHHDKEDNKHDHGPEHHHDHEEDDDEKHDHPDNEDLEHHHHDKEDHHEHEHEHHHEHASELKASPNALRLGGFPPLSVQQEYLDALAKMDWDSVEKDIQDLLTNSQEFWPADYGHYGGLFVRLSWHSCGSYRASDGRGGCDGGGQRLDPERSWPDNTNLDKARRLLQPIKQKYGLGLSWGDLFALAGTVAIASMGGPQDIGFCAGRVDFVTNEQTRLLGPTPEQDKFAHCPIDGQCPFPLGQNTLGLIYVNPEGPMGEPDLQGAADTIRDVFGRRMDWEGRELVALIGGGHSVGKAHGATRESPGKLPSECPFAPWDGRRGMDAVTSGFEGPWTSEPTVWDNTYFQYLVDYKWEPWQGPGGHWQWRVKGGHGPQAPAADPHSVAKQDVMMLTTDVALIVDDEYRPFVHEFAKNQTALEHAFKHAWYKLVTRDMGPASRCVGPKKPNKPRGFQHDLPPPSSELADMDKVAKDLRKHMKKNQDQDEFMRLAWQCASTFRATDYQGGCNGARIRFSPGKDWPTNAGLNVTLEKLEPIKKQYGKGLSYSDLIVLAGNVAAELRGSPKLLFCPGRTDAADGRGWNHLAFGNEEYPATVDEMMELYQRRGQTAQDFVALLFGHYDTVKKLQQVLDSQETGSVVEEGLRFYPELRYWAEHYVSAGDDDYRRDFASAWTKLMNADRFDGPLGNACDIE